MDNELIFSLSSSETFSGISNQTSNNISPFSFPLTKPLFGILNIVPILVPSLILIFILPSFTEGHPQVLDEALSRLRPVIVFEEIDHVKRNRKGVFVCKRNINDLENKIDFILKHYLKIQDEMKTNKLPKKNSFLKELKTILVDDN